MKTKTFTCFKCQKQEPVKKGYYKIGLQGCCLLCYEKIRPYCGLGVKK